LASVGKFGHLRQLNKEQLKGHTYSNRFHKATKGGFKSAPIRNSLPLRLSPEWSNLQSYFEEDSNHSIGLHISNYTEVKLELGSQDLPEVWITQLSCAWTAKKSSTNAKPSKCILA
jgi:hypothetical protein